LLKEAAALAGDLNTDDDMPELKSVTPPNMTATNGHNSCTSFEKYIFDLDETGILLGKQVDASAAGSSNGSSKAHSEEVDEVERMALQIGSISRQDWELMRAAYLANLK
jgi:hypothetical protein